MLRHHTLIGRSPEADLVLSDRQVSTEHAVVYYGDDGWVLKDLGSRNGTYLNNRRVEPQVRELLRGGDTLSFGGRVAMVIVDDTPPAASARRLDTGETVVADLGLLVLPQTKGVATVLHEDGIWWLDRGEQRAAAHNRQVIVLDGVEWELALPQQRLSEDRTESIVDACDLAQVDLHFAVSSDEEHVQITVESPAGSRSLPTRTFGYLLLQLARARVRDSQQPELSEREHGWMYTDDLMRDLGVDAGHLNVDIFRARKLFELAQLRNASDVIERRAGTRQVRLGTGRVKITRL